MSELVRLTGLWKGKKKDGTTYLSGTLGSAKIVVFPNDRKNGDKDPDFVVYLSKPEEKGQSPATTTPSNPFD